MRSKEGGVRKEELGVRREEGGVRGEVAYLSIPHSSPLTPNFSLNRSSLQLKTPREF
jgi:hypothetical protein